MVAISFDLSAYEFDQGIRAIELMWVAGCQVLDLQEKEILQFIVEFDFLEASGRLPTAAIVTKEDAVDEGNRLRLELMAVENARKELNNATVIVIYHHWERFVPGDSPTQIRTSQVLRGDAAKSGIEMHADLGALVSCANYLKHGNPARLTELLDNFPDRFPNIQKDKEAPTWLRRLVLNDDHIKWMFEIVKRSWRPICQLP